ncbi:MAG TPA: type II secretion system protein F [Firmicutes bacterium]|nr:type II secretion system protein F [Bacillota bacterium]
MAKFKYRALNTLQEKVEGTYEATSKDEVIALIESNNLYPLLVEEVIESTNINIGRKKKVKMKDIAVFCRQFYTMLDAGVHISECLSIMKTQVTNETLRTDIADVHEDVRRGDSLADSMAKHPDSFPDLLVKMVKSGELSGNLDTIMLRMSVFYEKENKINSKIKAAMIYPSVLAVVAAGAVTVILTFVMPMFMEMFEENGVELPWITKMLIALSQTITENYILIIIILLCSWFAFKMYSRSEHGKLTISTLKLRVPILKPLNEKIITSRFTRTLSTLLASGIPLATGVQIVSEVVQNKVAEDALQSIRESLVRGDGLSKPVSQSGIFPRMLSSMIAIGEETGSLDEILNKTADFYDDELEAQITTTTALIEPLLIVVMGVVIGGIVLSIMLPMFEMYTII